MDHLDIVEVGNLNEAHEWVTDGDDCPGELVALNLTKGPSPEELREAALVLEGQCCGFGQGVVRIQGELWYVASDFGH